MHQSDILQHRRPPALQARWSTIFRQRTRRTGHAALAGSAVCFALPRELRRGRIGSIDRRLGVQEQKRLASSVGETVGASLAARRVRCAPGCKRTSRVADPRFLLLEASGFLPTHTGCVEMVYWPAPPRIPGRRQTRATFADSPPGLGSCHRMPSVVGCQCQSIRRGS